MPEKLGNTLLVTVSCEYHPWSTEQSHFALTSLAPVPDVWTLETLDLHWLDCFTIKKASDLRANFSKKLRSWSSGNSALDTLNSVCVCTCTAQHLQGEPYQCGVHPPACVLLGIRVSG